MKGHSTGVEVDSLGGAEWRPSRRARCSKRGFGVGGSDIAGSTGSTRV